MEIVNSILKFVILVLTTFFSCQVVTGGKKRISYIGTLLICFSSATLEYLNYGLVEALVAGELILLSLHRFLYNSSRIRYLYAIAVAVGILGFFLLSNTTFQIPIGIVFLTLILWELLEYRKSDKKIPIKKSEKWVLTLGIMIALILVAAFYDYVPMGAIEKESGSNYLTSYLYNEFIVFDRDIRYVDTSCLASFISIFPIALIIGVCYIFKEENKHLKFIIPTVIVSILELIYIFLNKTISFLPNYIFVLGFNLLQIYMIIYIFARIEEKLFSLKSAAFIALAASVLIRFMPCPSKNIIFADLAYLWFVFEAYLVLNYSDKRFWRLSSWMFTLICLFEFIGYAIVKFV